MNFDNLSVILSGKTLAERATESHNHIEEPIRDKDGRCLFCCREQMLLQAVDISERILLQREMCAEITRLKIRYIDNEKEWFQVIESICNFHPVSQTDALNLGISKTRRMKEETARLRAALTELTAAVKGECPSLLNEDSGGDGKLAVEIDDLLSNTKVCHVSPRAAAGDKKGN